MNFSFTGFANASEILEKIFKEMKLPITSGGTDSGWSMWSTLQKCPRAYELKYVKEHEIILTKSSRDVGSLVHAFLATHYYCINKSWPTLATTLDLKTRLQESNINPQSLLDAWRLYDAYRQHYQFSDYLIPWKPEYAATDHEKRYTCRYDLIAKVRKGPHGYEPGWYNVEHKTAAQFSEDVLDGWDLDGEILGQHYVWDHSPLRKKLGPLQGTIVNIIGKQKAPKFHRTLVSAKSVENHMKEHWRSITHIDRLRKEFTEKKYFPRMTANCIQRYGKCDFYDVCRVGG